MWSVISMVLPWSSFFLAGALLYFITRTRVAERDNAEKIAKVRELSALNTSLRTEIYSLRSSLVFQAKELEAHRERLEDATRRALLLQQRGEDLARRVAEGASTEEAHRRLMELLDA